MHTSVNCLAGTGDFRIFIGGTGRASRVTDDGFANTSSYEEMDRILSQPPFSLYRGWDFRIFPHVSIDATRYAQHHA